MDSTPTEQIIAPYEKKDEKNDEKKDASLGKKQESIWLHFDALSFSNDDRERMNRLRDHPHRRSYADIYAISNAMGSQKNQNMTQNNNKKQKRKSWNNVIMSNED